MYIRKVEIKNIRSIADFSMDFEEGKEAGWHVLIGENGAGKSTIVRSIAAVLIGPEEIGQVRPYWEEWLAQKASEGSIRLQISYDKELDRTGQTPPPKKKPIENEFVLKRNGRVALESNYSVVKLSPKNFNWGNNKGWFSVAYGPFRRFTGGNSDWNKVYYSAPKAGAHLSVFGEDIALSEALEWLKELDRKRLKMKSLGGSFSEPKENYQSIPELEKPGTEADLVFFGLQQFINNSELLPHGAHFKEINLDGEPVFEDGNGSIVKITQLSDGFRSILSLTFELIRQLVRVYGAEEVFRDLNQDNIRHFDLPGVVLIDEIDAHLHPTWQTRIGQWFTRYFPNLQFIVTTHSPLICRGCVNESGGISGSIWRLTAPGSEEEGGLVSEKDLNRLVFGNVLDAYGTGVFGTSTSRSKEGNKKMDKLAELNVKSRLGKISKDEEKEMTELKTMFPTHP